MPWHGGHLESDPAVTLLGTHELGVTIIPIGEHAETDYAALAVATAAEDVDIVTPPSGPLNLAGDDPGQPLELHAALPMESSPLIYYCVKFLVGGSLHVSPVYHTISPGYEHERIRMFVVADGHDGAIRNIAFKQSATLVKQQLVENITTKLASSNIPSFIVGLGDNQYTKAGANETLKYPVDENGIKQAGATSHFALSQADCDIDSRRLRVVFGEMLAYAQFSECVGNHGGGQHWHYSENNSGNNDLAAQSIAAHNKYFGNQSTSGFWSGDSLGRWGSRRIGPILYCKFDPYIATELDTTSPATAPQRPDRPGDWTLGTDQWEHFFHADTGVIRNADPEETPFIVCCAHNWPTTAVISGEFANYGWHHTDDLVDKVADHDSQEHGPGTNWENDYEYTGEHSTLGVHGALVASRNETGCAIICLSGHTHFYSRKPIDGIMYVSAPKTVQQEASSPYAYGFALSVGARDANGWTDTDEDFSGRRNGGHLQIDATYESLTLKYIRAAYPGLLHEATGTPLEPPDGIKNNTVVDSVTLVPATVPVSRVRDSGNRTVEDSLTPAASGSTQPTPLATEPKSATTQFGSLWRGFTSGTDENIAVRASTIDGARVLSTRRRTAAGATQVHQTVCRGLTGIDREISCKIRVTNLNPTIPQARIGIAAAAENWSASPTAGEGLILRIGTSGSITAMNLYWGDSAIAQADPNYTVPHTTFDAGVRVILRGRNCLVLADDGTGALTPRINADIGATAYAAIAAGPTYRHVGIGGSANNAAGQGRITEFKDFDAKDTSSWS